MHEKLERIKQHFADNKKVYVAAGVGFVVGVAAVVILRKVPYSPGITQRAIGFWKPKITQIATQIYINALGDPGNVVQCVETGTIYASQGQAARELGQSTTDVSNHLHGKNSNLNGLHLIILGKAGEVLAENT